MAVMTQQKRESKENKEGASEDRAECCQSEEQIRQDAASEQGCEIEDCFGRGQLASHFVDGGKREDDKHPDRTKEKTQNGRQLERVESRVIVIKHPCLRDAALYAGIE